MGRFSAGLSTGLADLAEVHGGQRVLDVGAGPGALSTELARRVGEDARRGHRPVPAVRRGAARAPAGADVRRGTAERLPHPDDTFDAALAQLVVHFMSDPVAGIREMARVTVPGGVVAACVWDHAGGRSPLSTCWSAIAALDPDAVDEGGLPGVRAGHLAQIFADAGLDGRRGVRAVRGVDVHEPRGVVGAVPLRHRPARGVRRGAGRRGPRAPAGPLRRALGPAPFTVDATAWAVRARVDPGPVREP